MLLSPSPLFLNGFSFVPLFFSSLLLPRVASLRHNRLRYDVDVDPGRREQRADGPHRRHRCLGSEYFVHGC